MAIFTKPPEKEKNREKRFRKKRFTQAGFGLATGGIIGLASTGFSKLNVVNFRGRKIVVPKLTKTGLAISALGVGVGLAGAVKNVQSSVSEKKIGTKARVFTEGEINRALGAFVGLSLGAIGGRKLISGALKIREQSKKFRKFRTTRTQEKANIRIKKRRKGDVLAKKGKKVIAKGAVSFRRIRGRLVPIRIEDLRKRNK